MIEEEKKINWWEKFSDILGVAVIIFLVYFFFIKPNPINNEMNSQIDKQCTLDGRGEVECTFINDGAREGSICTKAIIKRRNGVKHVNKFDSSAYESAQRVCSGLIKPGDVAQRQYNVLFKDKSGNQVDITEFCDIEGFGDAWYDGCVWSYKEQAYSRE